MKQFAVALLVPAVGLFVSMACVPVAANLAVAGEPAKLFRLGMTQEEMVAAFGEPQSYLDLEKQRHISRKEYLAAGDSCKCDPLYSRKTARNEYEIRAHIKPDKSASRLHPVQRVNEVRFTLDHDMSPEEALDDIAEAKALCDGGCARGKLLGFPAYTRPEIKIAFVLGVSQQNPSKVEWISMVGKD